jgi:hypothetical protein
MSEVKAPVLADRQWFVDQSVPVIESVPCGDRTIYVRSLDFLEKSMASARASKAATVNDVLDQELFALENAVHLVAASVCDESGRRIFSDTEEDHEIVRKLRSKIGDLIDRKIQSLSFADRESPVKN